MNGFKIKPEDNSFSLSVGTPFNVAYGLLYNWYAATDVRYIASVGWHVPTNSDASILMRYLDNSGTNNNNTAGGKLKSIETEYWSTPNTGATNEAGFNAKGCGGRYLNFDFSNVNVEFSMWHYESVNAASAWRSYIRNNQEIFYTYYNGSGTGAGKMNGSPIRLIKDSTTLSDGEIGIYTGNDGRIYETICIGAQEWLSENLTETKYRNGDAIPHVTDYATWIALTTGALCAYDNDWDNVFI